MLTSCFVTIVLTPGVEYELLVVVQQSVGQAATMFFLIMHVVRGLILCNDSLPSRLFLFQLSKETEF